MEQVPVVRDTLQYADTAYTDERYPKVFYVVHRGVPMIPTEHCLLFRAAVYTDRAQLLVMLFKD